jgi:hypothetical protein
MDDLLYAFSNITHIDSPVDSLLMDQEIKVEILTVAAGFRGSRTKFARFLSHIERV